MSVPATTAYSVSSSSLSAASNPKTNGNPVVRASSPLNSDCPSIVSAQSSLGKRSIELPPWIEKTPPEIWDLICTYVPSPHLQRTALSLLLVFPSLPLSTHHLWRHVVVSRGTSQLRPLYAKIRQAERDGEDVLRVVRTFEMRSWTGDADLMVNIVSLMAQLKTIRLNVGTNFAPDHLDDCFSRHRPDLERILVRFKPYVEKASYYQFLKGSYFDIAIEQLTKWPESHPSGEENSLTFISLIQEVAPRHLVDASTPPPVNNGSIALDTSGAEKGRGYTGHGPFPYLDPSLSGPPKQVFAQPFIFFNISCITNLSVAPIARRVTHLRFRIPQRDVSTPLSAPNGFPSLTFLDISTSNLRLEGGLVNLLKAHAGLEHLILDYVNLFGFLGKDKGAELCRMLGKEIVMVGLARSKEMEREILLYEMEKARTARLRSTQARLPPRTSTDHNDHQEADEVVEAIDALAHLTVGETSRTRRRGGRSMAVSTFSIRERASRTSASSAAVQQPEAPVQPSTLSFVLPSLPRLRSFSLGGEARLTQAQREEWEAQFQAGWMEGLDKLRMWAGMVGERYQRALKKNEMDQRDLEKAGGVDVLENNVVVSSNSAAHPAPSSSSSSSSHHTSHSRGHRQHSHGKGKGSSSGKGKGAASSTATPSSSSNPSSSTTTASKATSTIKPKPYDGVRLFRYPTPSDSRPPTRDFYPSADPASRLIEVQKDEAWMDSYIDLLLPDQPNQCVFCTVADEPFGPLRRGEGGFERHDNYSAGVGGSFNNYRGEHKKGCGHLLGRAVWGDE